MVVVVNRAPAGARPADHPDRAAKPKSALPPLLGVAAGGDADLRSSNKFYFILRPH